MALESQDQTVSESVVDASQIKHDRVFEELITAISPKTITSKNKALIEAFVDILAEVSPTSVNIIDVFSKDVKAKNIENIQDNFAKMYLNNFYYVWKKAENDYILRNRLENILKKYQSLNNDKVLEGISFFDDEKSMYTSERYILGKDFKEKKGTATAIEYAYKVGWLAGIEGPLRTDYEFELIQEECTGGVSEGFYICDSLITPCSGEGGSGTSKLINEFIISKSVTESTCTPFTYKIEGSMLPELFEAFVVPLAHPVGFRYIYSKVLKLAFTDYFNLENVFSADEVNVYSLCPNSDCSKVKTTLLASKDDGGISKSHLKYIEEGKIYVGKFEDYTYTKYTFENKDYVIEYVLSTVDGVDERIIQYFNYSQLMNNNMILNGDFSTNLHWNILDGSSWIIDNSINVGKLNNGLIGDYISYPISLEVGEEYYIQIAVSQLSGAGRLSLGTWQKYNDNGDPIVGAFDEVYFDLDSDLTYKFYYTARGGEYFRIEAAIDNSSFNIDNIILTKNSPALEYLSETHSSIQIVNLSLPKQILYTHDILESFDIYSSILDDMNDLYYLYGGDLNPYIGDIIINDFYYGESTYTLLDKINVYDTKVVSVERSNTVDYKVLENSSNGTLNTIYQAVFDLGSVDLYLEDFNDTNRWTVFLYNSDPGDPDTDVTNEGGFIIGNYVIPWGDPNTAYMFDDFNFEVFGPNWISNFIDDGFIDISKWILGESWTFEESTTPSLNKVSKILTVGSTELQRTIYRNLDIVPDSGHYMKVTADIYILPESVNYSDTWIDIYVGDNQPIRYYDGGYKEIMVPYNGNTTIKMIASDGFEGSINNVLSICCSSN